MRQSAIEEHIHNRENDPAFQDNLEDRTKQDPQPLTEVIAAKDEGTAEAEKQKIVEQRNCCGICGDRLRIFTMLFQTTGGQREWDQQEEMIIPITSERLTGNVIWKRV